MAEVPSRYHKLTAWPPLDWAARMSAIGAKRTQADDRFCPRTDHAGQAESPAPFMESHL